MDRLNLVAVVIIINNHEPNFCSIVKPNYPFAAYDETLSTFVPLPKEPFEAAPK